jgi:MFS family permease
MESAMNGSNEAQAYIAEAASQRALQLSLLVIATAQLMLVLDDTIANIALPSIQRDLGVSQGMLPWIVNAYVLAFGSLLLFGGRLGDLFGRRLVLRIVWAFFPSRRCSVDSAGMSCN